MMLSRVDLPQPLGPTMQTNSPGATSTLTSSSTCTGASAVLPGNDIQRFLTGNDGRAHRAIGVAPAHLVEGFQPANEEVEHEADEADHDHAGHDEVVAFAGVARVDDEIAEAAVDRDHLGRHHDQPGDPERDAEPGDDLRKRGAEDDEAKELALA